MTANGLAMALGLIVGMLLVGIGVIGEAVLPGKRS